MPVEGGDLNGWPHTDVPVRAFGGGQAPPLHAEGVGPRGTRMTPPTSSGPGYGFLWPDTQGHNGTHHI